MLYVAGEILLWMLLAFALGIAAGWLIWGLRSRTEDQQSATERQQAATLRDEAGRLRAQNDELLALHARDAATIAHLQQSAGGDTAPRVVPFASTRLIGWWDDQHLAVWRSRNAGYEAVVIDLKGQVVRVLATAPSKSQFDDMGFRFSRGTP